MQTITPMIKEDIEFQRGLMVQEKLEENFPKSGTELISSVWTLKINTF
jgi:hypothetical protein